MITTMSELRQAIAENCDFSKPLRVVALDVGKKAKKHSLVYVDAEHPATMKVSEGMYSSKGVMEFSHDPAYDVLMPEAALAALDELLEEAPKTKIGWVYFFYFPMDYTGFLGRVIHIKDCLLDTREVKNMYLLEADQNTLVIEAEYNVGSFD